MTLMSLEAITTFSGIGASVAAAVAAFIRFRTSQLDRTKQARMESAIFLKEKGSEPWQVEFGTEQLLRIHFKTLTGIDRTSGHEAIRRCQQELGGTDREWDRLRGVGQFLDVTGHTARVREPQGRDHVYFFSSVIAAIVSAGLGFLIMAVTAKFLDQTPPSSIRLINVLMIISAVVWASTCALVVWGSARYSQNYHSARRLSRELSKLEEEEKGDGPNNQ